MKYLIELLILVLFTSCGIYNFKSVTGVYRTKGGFEWGSSISINDDSTFTYTWQSGLVGGKTTGKWYINRNNLILNSDLQPQLKTKPKYYLLEAEKSKSDVITFNLFWPDSINLLAGAIGIMYQNGDTISGQISDLNGQMVFKKMIYDSINIYFIGLRPINIQDNLNDYFKIVTVDNTEDSYEYFTDEAWKIFDNYLIDNTRNKNYYEKRFYKIK